MNGSNAIILLCAILAQPGDETRRAPSESPFTARTVAVLKGPDDDPMLLPTAVTVAPSGRVYVADGVNNRIVEFDLAGLFLGSFTRIGESDLSGAMSIKADGDGNLWIVDTENERVLVRGTDGELVRTINVAGPVDLTDIALVNSGLIWLVDNEHHRLIRHDLASGSFEHYGQFGEARGQFHHPFMAAVDANGVVYVSDSINGRVQGLRDPKVLPRQFGAYGVDRGQFHRPKGVALDAAGRLVVIDGSLGVVQYFDSNGTFVDALRDEKGMVLRFDTPCGIAMDGMTLYVTEMIPGQVRKMAITTRDVKPDFSPPRKAPVQRQQPTTCTVCHLEWMPNFSTNSATDLSAPPLSSPDEPYVSSATSCLTCHDGSVVDSRRKVWREHGHRTGVIPPQGMMVPRDMPLVDGTLACRTCHSAHTRGGAGQTMADAVFLRVSGHADELCIRCHTNYTASPGSGNHPTINFANPLQPELLAAGARFAFEASSTGCLVCHSGHGSSRDRLLIPMASTQQLCVSCHSEISIAAEGPGKVRLHPVRGTLPSQQQGRVQALGGKLHDDENLDCLSCHNIHHAPVPAKLLIKPQKDSELCMECHSTYVDVFGASHDLRMLDQGGHLLLKDCTVDGPCGACHGVHSLPFQPVVNNIDREGACIVCHQKDGCAASRTGQPFLHPTDLPSEQLDRIRAFTGRTSPEDSIDTMTCLSCHDPHARSDKSPMLRGLAADKPTELCFECHTDTRAIANSFHTADKFAHGKSTATDCAACHAIHAPDPTWSGGTWNAPTGLKSSIGNERCTGCHSAAGGIRDVAFRAHPALHLVNVYPENEPGYLPLMNTDGNSSPSGTIGCVTCHMPHGRKAGGGFSPPKPGSTPEPLAHAMKSMLRPYAAPNLCSSCHGVEGLPLFLYFHSISREEKFDSR